MKTPVTESPERTDREPRRENRLTDKVRRAAEEFDFTALLSGVRERRPNREPAPRPVSDESTIVTRDLAPAPLPPATPAPAPKPMEPSILEDQAAELRAIWNPVQPKQEEVIIAPSAPWQRSEPPARTAQRVIVHGAGKYDYARDGHAPPFWQGALNRGTTCVAFVIFGLIIGAAAAPFIHSNTGYRVTPLPAVRSVNSSAPAAAHNPVKPGASRKKTKQTGAPPSVKPIRTNPAGTPGVLLPIAILVAFALLWIAGLPLILGSLERAGFFILMLGVLFSAGWNGASGVLTLIENREAGEKLKVANKSLRTGPSSAPRTTPKSARP